MTIRQAVGELADWKFGRGKAEVEPIVAFVSDVHKGRVDLPEALQEAGRVIQQASTGDVLRALAAEADWRREAGLDPETRALERRKRWLQGRRSEKVMTSAEVLERFGGEEGLAEAQKAGVTWLADWDFGLWYVA